MIFRFSVAWRSLSFPILSKNVRVLHALQTRAILGRTHFLTHPPAPSLLCREGEEIHIRGIPKSGFGNLSHRVSSATVIGRQESPEQLNTQSDGLQNKITYLVNPFRTSFRIIAAISTRGPANVGIRYSIEVPSTWVASLRARW